MNAPVKPQPRANKLKSTRIAGKLVNDYWEMVWRAKEEGKLVRRIMSPTGFGDPEDVAAVVALLLSDDGKHITGECIRIDGGTHA